MPKKLIQSSNIKPPKTYPENFSKARHIYNTTIGRQVSLCNESYVIDVLKNNSDFINFFKTRNIVFTSFNGPIIQPSKCDIIGNCLDQEIGLQVKHAEVN